MDGGPNRKNKSNLLFHDGLVSMVGLTVEIKLRFRDGLVWTVGLTVEIKLCFQISPVRRSSVFDKLRCSFRFRISVDGSQRANRRNKAASVSNFSGVSVDPQQSDHRFLPH